MIGIFRSVFATIGLAAVLVLGAGSTASAQSQRTVLRPTQITGFQSPEARWQQTRIQRVLDTWFIFDQSGAFYYYPIEDYQLGLPAYQGRWSNDASGAILFEAISSKNFNAGISNTRACRGVIQNRGGQLVFAMDHATSAITTAVVNDIPFGSSSASAYHIEGVLGQAQ